MYLPMCICKMKEVTGEKFPACLVRGEKQFDCVESECLNFICYTGKVETALRN